jgi:hypothetical protein
MRRVLRLAVGAYLGAALIMLYRERIGRLRCECLPDCWCKRPSLSLFR